MPGLNSYSSVVANRTTTALTIRATPELLALYVGGGGLPEDLDEIIRQGQAAEAANLGQSLASSASSGATDNVLASFEALRTEYSAVMAAVQATRNDLARAGASADVLSAIDQILANETPLRLVEPKKEGDKPKMRKVQSFESVRAEIAKDAGALLATTGAHEALAKRKVTIARLTLLKSNADSLVGKVGERTVSKGAAKAATAVETAAVKAQREIWGSSYRLLAAVGRQDARVAALLAAATAKGKS